MKHYYLFIFLLINFSILSQNVPKHVFYLNENLKEIDSSSYHVKSRSVMYKSLFFKIGDTIIHKLSKEYDFGKLNQEKYFEIVDTLNKLNNKKNSQKNIILIYNNYLLGYSDSPESVKTKNYANNYLNKKKEYIRERKKYDKKQKKCLRKFSSEIFHLYTHQINFNHKPKFFKHYKAPNFIKETFFRFKEHGVIILKPNGNYFFYKFLTEKQLNKMLSSEWKDYIKNFNESKINPNINVKFLSEMKIERAEEIDLLAERHYNFNREKGWFRNNRFTQDEPYYNRTSGISTIPNLTYCYEWASY